MRTGARATESGRCLLLVLRLLVTARRHRARRAACCARRAARPRALGASSIEGGKTTVIVTVAHDRWAPSFHPRPLQMEIWQPRSSATWSALAAWRERRAGCWSLARTAPPPPPPAPLGVRVHERACCRERSHRSRPGRTAREPVAARGVSNWSASPHDRTSASVDGRDIASRRGRNERGANLEHLGIGRRSPPPPPSSTLRHARGRHNDLR